MLLRADTPRRIHRALRRVSAVLTLGVLLAGLTASHAFAYRCAMDGLLHADRCCPHETAQPAPANAADQLDEPDCCAREDSQATTSPALLTDGHLQASAALAGQLSASSPIVVAPAQRALAPWAARGPPRPPAAPRFVLHCAFLI